MDREKMARELVKAAQAFTEPLNLEPLLKKGILKKKGRSYYVHDMNLLPEKARRRVKTITQTKEGMRVTFHKEKKSLKKVVEQFGHYL